MCDNEFVTLIQVRRPLERIISHIKMGWRQYGEVCMAQRPLFFTNESIRDVNHWHQLMPGPLDNFYIRSLLGESVFFLPLGKITEAHLNQARMLMTKRIDVFTVMERPDRWAQSLKYGMGWCDTEDIVCRANSAKHNQGLPAALPLHWARELQAINDLDIRFYNYVTLLSKLDAVMYQVAESAIGDTLCMNGVSNAGRWEGCKNLELIKKQKETNANTTGHAVALLAAKGGGTLMSSLSNLTNTLSSANVAAAATRRSLHTGN
ncbi:hypothetical protein HYH03_018606 [Edaphochlamys debaryana]|uniref:Uncharacterized protein n=1 Tax=Edaphochlamys debaryana TaxID=47281 RepID=A0A835XFP1_9CHLO|nr:hypothetical protein HYH03_018606 [Edaphochlamys debaryana]|eukprot:KAG2482460.1 hypothetical protein HYH03_018606 [Edaphochlamys debaryana]